MKKSTIAIILIIVLSFAVGIYFYPQMPDMMISHWGIEGEPNGQMSKFWGLFLMPIMSVILATILILVPKIDPLKENIKNFGKYFEGFIVIFFLFLFYIYLLTIFWNLGIKFDFIFAMVPAFTILFYYTGVLIEHAEKNWSIGIRTPWTMSSEKVWNKTHKLGGKLFKLSALIGLIGLFFKDYAIYFIIIPILASSLFLFLYSYLEYRKEKA